ncbi:hypothetical protein KSP40_PGU005437 [Platanthera guangdongensis]|uniref:Secreted protein n=1 Tax=Platanthera guangdongensis TaxID=2320717 RepID=A0ABR2MVC4_9ASPA
MISYVFPQLKWHHVLITYIFAPPVPAFCNVYESGLADWPLASTCRKLAIFVYRAWVGAYTTTDFS